MSEEHPPTVAELHETGESMIFEVTTDSHGLVVICSDCETDLFAGDRITVKDLIERCDKHLEEAFHHEP